jgi:hypothetical protein
LKNAYLGLSNIRDFYGGPSAKEKGA